MRTARPGEGTSETIDWAFVRRWALPILAIGAAATAVGAARSSLWNSFDLGVYLEAGRRAALGKDPYGFAQPPIGALYRYSPLFAVLMEPLSSLPVPLVALGWRLTELALLAASVRGLGWVGAMIILNPLVVLDLSVANVSTLILAGMIAVVRWPSARSITLYALLFILIPKPTLVPVLAWGLWRVKEARRPSGLVLALGGATLLIPGFAGALLSGSRIFGLMQNLQSLPPVIVYAALFAAACLTVASTRWSRLLGIASVLATPYYFDYGWVPILLALVPAGGVSPRQPAPRSGSPSSDAAPGG